MSEKGDVPFLGKLSSQPQSPGGNRGKGTPPMLKVITTKAETPADAGAAVGATLDELARAGAQRMIAAALQLEVEAYVTRFRAAPYARFLVSSFVTHRGTCCPVRTGLRRCYHPPTEAAREDLLAGGHMIWHEAPNSVASALVEFLR